METFVFNKEYVVISICEPDQELPNFVEDLNRSDVFKLEIHDVDDVFYAEKFGYTILSEEDAINILNFMERVKNQVEFIVIHCFAGKSRSSGLAAALYKIYEGDDSIIMENQKYIPNMYVYRTVLNTAYNMGIYDPKK